jgi:hypothetical protein
MGVFLSAAFLSLLIFECKKGAVARNEMCSSLIFMQKDNPVIFKPRD